MGKKKYENSYLDTLEDQIEEIEEDQPVTVRVSPKITFRDFFQKKLVEGKVQTWEDKALLIFFSKRCLTELEEHDCYEKMFKIY